MHRNKIKYYRLTEISEELQGGWQTAAIVSCIGCGIGLASMGGGSNHVCENCIDFLVESGGRHHA